MHHSIVDWDLNKKQDKNIQNESILLYFFESNFRKLLTANYVYEINR
jgi:hypothetical protein